MSTIRFVVKVLLIIFAIAMSVVIFSPKRPVRCCYVCEHRLNDTDTWCKNCAYRLDSVVIRNMKWFETESSYDLYSKSGLW